ncbi:Cof-type HAD-IIB family hydrolase [Eubacteriales bacterium OttesenSCG-928-M02]|nr:Cof-type HAD-IIB family hydrolase [Eubacteriales bacterium OttesenSCG-928-M02]
MSGIKMIVTDIDGTLVDEGKRVPQRNIDAIKEAKARGIKVCASSTRHWPAARNILREAGITDESVLCNGAVLFDVAKEEAIKRWAIPSIYVDPLLQVGLKHGSFVNIMGTNCTYMWKESVHPHHSRRGQPENNASFLMLDTYDDFVEAAQRDCNIIFVWTDHENHIPLYADMCAVGDFMISAADEDHVYLMARNATKGNAVSELAKRYGISPDEVMAVGDSKNDASMLRWAGLGVAMGNGNQLAKDTADVVTGTNVEGGLGQAIEKYVLV